MAGPKIITDYPDIGGYSASSIISLADPNTGYLYKTALSSINNGIQGQRGPSGPIGIIGIQGRQGRVGIGFTGSSGTQGPQGNIGIQGFAGVGTDGPQGYLGLQGLQGYQGASPGFQSSRGFQGAQGIIGLNGFQGFQGIQGYLGKTSSIGIQGIQGTPLILFGTYSHILVYNSAGTLSTAVGFKYIDGINDTFIVPGYNGAGSSTIELNGGTVHFASGGINGLQIKLGTGSTNVDIKKKFSVYNNDVIYNDMYSVGGVPKPGYINNNIIKYNSGIELGIMNFQSTHWSTSGLVLNIAGGIVKDITSTTSSIAGELVYNSFSSPTFESRGVTYTDISNIYISGSPIVTGTGSSTFSSSSSLKIATGKTLFGGGLKISNMPEYIDNTDAISNGLTAGDIYRLADVLKIVH